MTEEETKKDEEKTEEKKPSKIEKVYVFMTNLPNGGEGIVSVPTPGGLIPLVALDEKQFGHFSEMAQAMANESGRDIWVVAFKEREEVKRFERELVQVPKMSMGAKVGEGGWKIGG